MADRKPASPALPKLTSFLGSATVASRPGFRLLAPTCLSTRSIRSTKAGCSAGATVRPNLPCIEYGRTSSEGLDLHPAPVSLDVQATEIWRRSPFYRMLQTGASLLRRRLNADTTTSSRCCLSGSQRG